MSKQRFPPARAGRRRRAGQHCITVMGLGAVGRQVAVQIASLSPRRLLLVDPAVVSRRTHAAEGYPHEDADMPKVHAAAHLCHQIDPQLDIQAVRRRSVRGLDLGHVCFCCPGAESLVESLRHAIADQIVFAASCHVAGSRIHLDFGLGVAALFGSRGSRRSDHSGPQPTALDIPTATVAAGLLVAEFLRFAEGHPVRRAICLDADTLALKAC